MLIFKFSSNNKCFFSRWLGQLQCANAMPLLFYLQIHGAKYTVIIANRVDSWVKYP